MARDLSTNNRFLFISNTLYIPSICFKSVTKEEEIDTPFVLWQVNLLPPPPPPSIPSHRWGPVVIWHMVIVNLILINSDPTPTHQENSNNLSGHMDPLTPPSKKQRQNKNNKKKKNKTNQIHKTNTSTRLQQYKIK